MGKSSVNGQFSMAMLNNKRVWVYTEDYYFMHTVIIHSYTLINSDCT